MSHKVISQQDKNAAARNLSFCAPTRQEGFLTRRGGFGMTPNRRRSASCQAVL
jgi:hypothetical protein